MACIKHGSEWSVSEDTSDDDNDEYTGELRSGISNENQSRQRSLVPYC